MENRHKKWSCGLEAKSHWPKNSCSCALRTSWCWKVFKEIRRAIRVERSNNSVRRKLSAWGLFATWGFGQLQQQLLRVPRVEDDALKIPTRCKLYDTKKVVAIFASGDEKGNTCEEQARRKKTTKLWWQHSSKSCHFSITSDITFDGKDCMNLWRKEEFLHIRTNDFVPQTFEVMCLLPQFCELSIIKYCS